MIHQNQLFISSLDSKSQKIVLEKLDFLVKNLDKEVSGIFLLGSFATGEYSVDIWNNMKSDIEFLVINSSIENKVSNIGEIQKMVNTNLDSSNARLSVRLGEKDLEDTIVVDPITLNHINQARSHLFGDVNYNLLNNKISDQSKLGLSGVAHMHYLKGLFLGDLSGLIKGPLTQIGVYLGSIDKYKASYRDRINEFKKQDDLMKSLGIDENDLRDLYTLKLCLDREIFKEKFGSIDNFNKKFNGFFTKQFFELIFGKDLMSYTNTVNKENLDNETCLRIFYISLLNNELELSIEMINFLLHSYGDIEQYVDIKNLNQLELLGIGLNLHKKHVETLGVFD